MWYTPELNKRFMENGNVYEPESFRVDATILSLHEHFIRYHGRHRFSFFGAMEAPLYVLIVLLLLLHSMAKNLLHYPRRLKNILNAVTWTIFRF